jgi:predicted ArsR family transcriptional regulator
VPIDLDTRLNRLAALGEPVRRALYRYVAREPEPVSREQAATTLHLAHHVAKFHLDRLVDDGLLEVEYRRPPGRGGPGAGRPAKRYRLAEPDLAASVPDRRYDLAGRLLVRALGRSERGEVPVADAVRQVAHDAGVDAARAGTATKRGGSLARAIGVLGTHGFEPTLDAGAITLSNCPFDALAKEDPALVCGMNRAFVAGVLAGLGADDLEAQLVPAPGRCCVRVCSP